MSDVMHIRTVYQKDPEVLNLLMTAATKEEEALDAGLRLLFGDLIVESWFGFNSY